jgi:hypothetical protein
MQWFKVHELSDKRMLCPGILLCFSTFSQPTAGSRAQSLHSRCSWLHLALAAGSLGVSISMTAGGGSEGLTGPFGGMGSVARSLLQQAGQGVASAVLGRAGRAGSGIGGGGDDLGLSQLGSGSWPSPADDGGKDYGDDGRTCMCPNEISHLSILWQVSVRCGIGKV